MQKKEKHSIAIDESLSLRLSVPFLLSFLLLVPAVMGAIGDQETFEDDTPGSDPSASWYTFVDNSGGSAFATVSAANSYAGSQSLILTTTTANNAITTFSFTPVSPTYLEWAMALPCGTGEVNDGAGVFITTDTGVVLVGVESDTCNLQASDSGSSDFSSDIGLVSGGWYKWRVDFDFGGGTYDVSVSDVMEATGLSLPASAATISNWRPFINADAGSTHTGYFDNFGVEVDAGVADEPPGPGSGFIDGFAEGLSTGIGISLDAALWIIALGVVAIVMGAFLKFGASPLIIAISALVGLGLAWSLGALPDWFVILVFLAVAALVANGFAGRSRTE